MTKLLQCYTIGILLLSLNTNAQSWKWIRTGYGNDPDEGHAVATDINGNVIVVGEFSSTEIVFGSDTLVNYAQNQLSDAFIVKYDSSGNELWAKNVLSCSGAQSVATDNNGNIFFAGFYLGPSTIIDTITLTTTSVASSYLAKLDPNGNVIWAKNTFGNYITTDQVGNCYVTGNYKLGTVTIGSVIFTNSGINTSDILLIKYDPQGNIVWAKSGGGILNEYSVSISTDFSGNVFIAGSFRSPIIYFDNDSIINSTNTDMEDIFLAKYDSSGNEIWLKGAGGNNIDRACCVTNDHLGNCYISGMTASDTTKFDSISIPNINIATSNAFLAKYNDSGNLQWVKKAQCYSGSIGWGVTTDRANNIYVLGGYTDSLFFIQPLNRELISIDAALFILKLNTNGDFLCLSGLSSGGDDLTGIDADNFGNVYVGGDYIAPMVIGNDTLFQDTINESIFVAKYSCTEGNALGEVKENKTFNLLSLYPNPATDQLTVTSDNHQIATVTVTDIYGRQIYTTKTNYQSSIINCQLLANGIYLLHYSDGKNQEVKKFVVEH